LAVATDEEALKIAHDCIEADAIFFLQGREVIGIQGYLHYRRRLREAFANLSLQVRSIRVEAAGQMDRVAVKWTLRGRPRASSNPNAISFHGINMYQFNGLFVTSAMNSYDVLSAISEAAPDIRSLELKEDKPNGPIRKGSYDVASLPIPVAPRRTGAKNVIIMRRIKSAGVLSEMVPSIRTPEIGPSNIRTPRESMQADDWPPYASPTSRPTSPTHSPLSPACKALSLPGPFQPLSLTVIERQKTQPRSLAKPRQYPS
jgi:hypothetical protein